MKFTFVLISVSILLSAACGDGFGGPDPLDELTEEPDTIVVSALDTLGVEMGDVPGVFAFIIDAAYTPEGNIAVLDAGKIILQVFSLEGDELLQVGRRGSGPGEYQMPMGLAVTSYGYVVSDISGGKLLRYNASGELLDEITGFFPVPPVRIRGGGDRFLATDIFMDMEGDDGMSVSMDFVAFADSSEPVTVFESHSMELNGGMINSSNAPNFAFAAGPEGEAYLVQMCDSLFLLSGYDPEGGELLLIKEEYERIPLTEEELAEEVMAISLTIENGETALGRSREPRTDTHRNIIEGIGVDGEGNIWVRMGDTGSTYFRIYSPSGELIHIAVPDESVAEDARYSISPEGMLAYDADPEDWPKVYLLGVR